MNDCANCDDNRLRIADLQRAPTHPDILQLNFCFPAVVLSLLRVLRWKHSTQDNENIQKNTSTFSSVLRMTLANDDRNIGRWIRGRVIPSQLTSQERPLFNSCKKRYIRQPDTIRSPVLYQQGWATYGPRDPSGPQTKCELCFFLRRPYSYRKHPAPQAEERTLLLAGSATAFAC